MRCALLSVALYGFSELGLYFAGSLWPLGHPFFYVWTIYFAISWAATRHGSYLIGAIVVCAAGMYVHMAIMPAVLVIPVVWILYRPPLQLWPTLIAIVMPQLSGFLIFVLNTLAISQILFRSQSKTKCSGRLQEVLV